MKFRSFLIVGLILVSFGLDHSEAVGIRKPLNDKTGLSAPATEKKEPSPISYFSEQKESLRGLKGVGILVESLSPEVETFGISRDQIKQEVEGKLKQAGIRVLDEEERIREPGQSYLYVNLNAYSWREEVIFGYSLKFDLYQLVLLDRHKKIGCFAATWSSGSAGIIGANKLSTFIQTELAETAAQFIKDFLAVNPK